MVRVATTFSIIALPLILACFDEIAYGSLRITVVPPGGNVFQALSRTSGNA
jgi:hypothetical protein